MIVYRKDTFEVTLTLDNSEEVKTDVYYTEDSTVTYDCQVIGELGTAEGVHTEVSAKDDDIEYENENGNPVILSEEDTTRIRERAFADTEERAHEEAWDNRYEDR